jgi:dolichyl-phosphate-mannose-protein mannosyltransferase
MVLPRIRPVIAPGMSLSQRGAAYFGMSGPAEFLSAASLFTLMIVFRIVNMLHYQFDSDEPQHLHVIWGWVHGFVQYRDLFDNHMPLFHIALAPILALVGERATILYWMRFVLLPMYGIAAWCTYRIGALLFSRRVGIWAVILVGFYPGYHFTSLEFRPDNLWVPLWLLCITVLVSGALTVPRTLVAGLLLGLCFGVSMKSTLFVVSLLVAAVVTLFLVGRDKAGQSWVHLARCGAAFFITTLMVPGVIMAFFALKGLWPEFRYCVFDFNVLAHAIANEHHSARFLVISSIAFACVIYATRRVIRATGDPALAFRRGFVLLTCASYLAALYSFWVLRTPQDYLPYHPLAFVFLTSAIITASTRLQTANFTIAKALRGVRLPAFVALLFLSISLVIKPFWNDHSREETDLLQTILTITNPGDYVFDCYGETVFRQRCCRPVLETITLKGMRRRIIPDTLAQDCVEKRTCVAVMTKGRTHIGTKLFKMFVSQNYLPVDRDFVRRNYPWPDHELRVAGAFLTPPQPHSNRIDFDVVIPARYEIIAPDGPVTGLLDGTPYEGARFLARGRHTFIETSGGQNLALLWAQAADRHFTPFKKRPSSAGG